MLQLEQSYMMPQLQAPGRLQLQGYDNVQLEGVGTVAMVGVGGAILGAALGGLVMGLSLNSYKKHGDSPVRGGVTYGVASLLTGLVTAGISMAVAGAVVPTE